MATRREKSLKESARQKGSLIFFYNGKKTLSHILALKVCSGI